MKPSYRYWIILAAIALVGSVVVQVVWIVKGYEQAESHLQVQLEKALSQTIEDLTVAEDIAFITQIEAQQEGKARVEVVEYHYMQDTSMEWHEVSEIIREEEVSVEDGDEVELRTDGEVNPEKGGHMRIEVRSGVPGKDLDTLIESENVRLDEVLEMERSGRLRQLLERIQVENIKQEDGWKNRIDSVAIEKKLRENITEKAITIPFAFAVTNREGEAFKNLRSRTYQPEASIWAAAPLFPADLRSKDVVLNVQLDARFSTLFKEIGWLTFLSLLFTLTMLLLFVLLWRQLLSQTKLSQMKTDFIGNMSHELRTPLATISLAADSINHPKTSADPSSIKPLIATIKREHDRILRHVDRVLQMAHAGQGGFPLERTSLDLPPWVEDIVASYQDRAKSEGKELTFQSEGGEANVEWDDLHVRSAIENLLDNALNYNPAGTNVLLHLSIMDDWIEISVKDDGIGISEEEQHLVFERFYRVQRGNLHEVKGFGLGLNYVQLVCEAHKGSLSLVSSEGKGAAFTMKLPKHG